MEHSAKVCQEASAGDTIIPTTKGNRKKCHTLTLASLWSHIGSFLVDVTLPVSLSEKLSFLCHKTPALPWLAKKNVTSLQKKAHPFRLDQKP